MLMTRTPVGSVGRVQISPEGRVTVATIGVGVVVVVPKITFYWKHIKRTNIPCSESNSCWTSSRDSAGSRYSSSDDSESKSCTAGRSSGSGRTNSRRTE